MTMEAMAVAEVTAVAAMVTATEAEALFVVVEGIVAWMGQGCGGGALEPCRCMKV